VKDKRLLCKDYV